MIDICYSVLQKHWNGHFRLFLYRIVKLFLNLFYPLYVRLTRPRGVDPASSVIVSLTSFPARISKVYLAVETLLRQTVPPQKVILWLAAEQFEGVPLPKTLLALKKYGLEIAFCEDLRSHKKYYYTMRNYPDATIITADDDTLYPESWVADLTKMAAQYPNTVVCMLAHQIRYTPEGDILPYLQWNGAVAHITAPRSDLMPVGCEGVLYPPHALHPDVFDQEFFMSACRNADDLWLKAMSLLNGIKVMTATAQPFTYVNLLTANIGALNAGNVDQCANDIQLKNILARYPQLRDLIITGDTPDQNL